MIVPPGLSFHIASAARRRTAARWLAVIILLFGAGLRIAALGRDARFHPDEAYFATFARNAAVQGDWLLHGNLDKPPLALYASALSMALIGTRPLANGVLDLNIHTGEFAARLPSALAGIVWVALMMALARRFYGHTTITLWAGLLAALSPMAILFSASTFTDGWMLLWMTAALWAVTSSHRAWSGLSIGLALAAKPQGLFYLPLALGIGWASHGWSWRAFAMLLLPAAGVLGLIALWDNLRSPSPSLFTLAAEHNAPAYLVSATGLTSRAQAWLVYLRGLFGPASALLVLLIGIFSLRNLFHRPRTQTMRIDLTLLAFTLAYILLHWGIAFGNYDRYWLPILPPLALLSARAVTWAYAATAHRIPRGEVQFVAIAMVAVLFSAALDATRGDPGYSNPNSSFVSQPEIDITAQWLADQHVAAVIYDHWLGWQLDYYLGAWSDKRRVYYPEPSALAEDAAQLNEPQPRFFPIPDGVDAMPWLDALAQAGFGANAVFEARGITIYQLERRR